MEWGSGEAVPEAPGCFNFYVDCSGDHGLEAKPADEANNQEWTAAVSAVSAYGSGWRFPTKTELNLLYRARNVASGFTDANYWSSKENNSNNAWNQNFNNNNQNNTLRARAVRGFKQSQ